MLNIKASDEALAKFNDLKLKKKMAYIIYKVGKADPEKKEQSVNTEKFVMKADCEDDNYLSSFIADVKESGTCRFAVVDWNHKVCHVSWVPDTAKAKDKMVYASVKEGFVTSLVGVQIKLQATDDAELSDEIIIEKTASKV